MAAATYVVVATDRVDWTAAGLVAAGSLVGGYLGGTVRAAAAGLAAAEPRSWWSGVVAIVVLLTR